MARPGTWSGLTANAFPRMAWDPNSQEPTAPCGSGLQPAPEGSVGLVTLIPSFRMAAAAGWSHTHTHSHTHWKTPHQLRAEGVGMCRVGEALLLPGHPPLATDLQNPALRPSQVPDMDGEGGDMAQVLQAHLSLASLSPFRVAPQLPHFHSKLFNLTKP